MVAKLIWEIYVWTFRYVKDGVCGGSEDDMYCVCINNISIEPTTTFILHSLDYLVYRCYALLSHEEAMNSDWAPS